MILEISSPYASLYFSISCHVVQVLQTKECGNLLISQRLPESYATLRIFVASDPNPSTLDGLATRGFD
jgi:hypothetical protein